MTFLSIHKKMDAVCLGLHWVGDDFWYPSMRNPPNASSSSEHSNDLKKSKKKPLTKVNGFLGFAGGIGEIRTLDKALHPILP